MPSEGPQVEFQREVAGPLSPDTTNAFVAQPALRFWSSVRIVRWVAMILGSAALAYLTHRSGLTLDAALCVFVGVLPVLWVFSWFAGITFGVRRVAPLVRSAMKDAQATALEGRRSQHVQLFVADDALEVTLKEGEQTESHRWAWRQVQLIRQQADVFWLRREGDAIEVPRSAFSDVQAFETFALAAQARIWAAMR